MPDPPRQPAVAAFIFDMDDTLARTAPLWRDAEEYLLRELGATWSEELAGQYKGMNALDVAATVHRALQPAQTLSQCQQLMRQRLIANFKHAQIQPIEGACELVRRCATVGVRMAVASGSPMEGIELTLGSLGIEDCFALRLSSERVARGKPHPDVFLAAAERLAVGPTSCVAFEDSLIGAQAARAAGMRCVVRPSLAHPKIAAMADLTVCDWSQVDVQQWSARD